MGAARTTSRPWVQALGCKLLVKSEIGGLRLTGGGLKGVRMVGDRGVMVQCGLTIDCHRVTSRGGSARAPTTLRKREDGRNTGVWWRQGHHGAAYGRVGMGWVAMVQQEGDVRVAHFRAGVG